MLTRQKHHTLVSWNEFRPKRTVSVENCDTNSLTFISKTWILTEPTFMKLTTNEYVIFNMSCTEVCPCWTKMYKTWTNRHSRLCLQHGFSQNRISRNSQLYRFIVCRSSVWISKFVESGNKHFWPSSLRVTWHYNPIYIHILLLLKNLGTQKMRTFTWCTTNMVQTGLMTTLWVETCRHFNWQ